MTGSRPGRILLVDDEPNILNALKRELSALPDHPVEVLTCTDPEEALKLAGKETFDLVISDFRMPQMDGISFLRKFSTVQPDAMRMMISGQADMETMQNAINESRVYRFIPKPWDTDFLRSAVGQALNWHRELLKNRQLAEIARQRGIQLPAQQHSEHYDILVLDDSREITHALWHDLAQNRQFDHLHALMLAESGVADIDIERPFKFNVSIFNVPAEALETAKHMHFDCALVDFRMPEMDGICFMRELSKLQPDCAKIMISGHIDRDLLADAINLGEIHSILAKPWNVFELKMRVIDAVDQHKVASLNKALADHLIEQHQKK